MAQVKCIGFFFPQQQSHKGFFFFQFKDRSRRSSTSNLASTAATCDCKHHQQQHHQGRAGGGGVGFSFLSALNVGGSGAGNFGAHIKSSALNNFACFNFNIYFQTAARAPPPSAAAASFWAPPPPTARTPPPLSRPTMRMVTNITLLCVHLTLVGDFCPVFFVLGGLSRKDSRFSIFKGRSFKGIFQ